MNLFDNKPLVLYSRRFDNLLIFTYPTLFMFATYEGSSKRKMCVTGIQQVLDETDSVVIGEL